MLLNARITYQENILKFCATNGFIYQKKIPAADPPAAAGSSPLPGAPGTFRRATRAVPSSRLSGTDLRDTLRWESATFAFVTFGKNFNKCSSNVQCFTNTSKYWKYTM